ncbi:MAG TPA: CBS domain-containing protein [Candidatus Udaeobacter sp.]|nr:CBS domain-containing protein [Candidatus Udaeobacter sp.]
MKWSVANVMTRGVVVVGPDTDFKTCVRQMQEHQVSALPVVDSGRRLVGIVSEADLLAKERRRGERRPLLGIRWEDDGAAAGRTAGEVMTSPAICISPEASIPEAARLMYREAVKRLPVVDAKGVVVGIVSRADLLKTFTRSDEAIRHDVVSDVITRALFLDPKSLHVEVVSGIVKLSGELETRSLCNLLVEMVGRIEGTVAVESKLTWRLDDSKLRVEKPPRSLQLSADER